MESNDLKMPGVGALMSKASLSAIQTTSSPEKQPPTANAIESRSHVSGPFGNIGSSTRKHKSGKRDRPEKNTIHEIRDEQLRCISNHCADWLHYFFIYCTSELLN